MAIDTLAYVKSLEAAGVERRAAEAHAEALSRHFVSDVATKADLESGLTALEHRLDLKMEQLEHRLIQRMDRLGHELTVRMVTFTLAIVGLLDAVLFTLLRFVH